MRCAAYSAVVNRYVLPPLSIPTSQLTNTRPLHIPPTDPSYGESAIGHFHDKLLHIRERLKTEAGRKMGEKRHQAVGLILLRA